jgi:hypothetical protein
MVFVVVFPRKLHRGFGSIAFGVVARELITVLGVSMNHFVVAFEVDWPTVDPLLPVATGILARKLIIFKTPSKA